ncbi:MAG TPA: proline dehydrogenase family protein [Myxococcaceae bacterium]|nr:proline dehydrogenase family protein [Myxococcaceae bacterium]
MAMDGLSRQAFIYLSRQEKLKDVALSVPQLRKVAERFVAGVDLAQALENVRPLTDKGCTISFDHLNETVHDADETRVEVDEYLRLLSRIDLAQLPANVSIKPTQLGLLFDPELAFQNARRVVEEAARRNSFVRVDMEGSNATQGTLELVRRLRSEFPANRVGVAIQAYLRRTRDDVRELLKLPVRFRLCKGAYLEPPELAFPDKADVDRNFVELMRLLLDSGEYHGIATHDEHMIEATVEHMQKRGLSKDAFEFQMLYGVRRDLQDQLLADGYRLRIYSPYGAGWYPYFMRRLAERPANVWFVLKNFFKP